jgi:hypothetical protein
VRRIGQRAEVLSGQGRSRRQDLEMNKVTNINKSAVQLHFKLTAALFRQLNTWKNSKTK